MNRIFYEKVTWFEKMTETENPHLYHIGGFLEAIKMGGNQGSLLPLINMIRNEHDDKKRKELKKGLPVIMWQGTFSRRSKEFILGLSGVLCIDIDHLSTEEYTRIKNELSLEPWVIAIFRSPSADGLKVLVKTDVSVVAIYENCYRQLKAMIETTHKCKADNNCINYGQGCYTSYDPDIFVNPNPQELHLEYDPAFEITPTTTQQASAHTPAAPKPISPVNLFLGQLGNGLSDEEIIEIAHKRFARYPNNYTDGYRTKAIFVQAATFCKAGIPMEKALVYLKEHFLPTSYDEGKLEYETSRAYAKWNDHFGTERGNYRP